MQPASEKDNSQKDDYNPPDISEQSSHLSPPTKKPLGRFKGHQSKSDQGIKLRSLTENKNIRDQEITEEDEVTPQKINLTAGKK